MAESDFVSVMCSRENIYQRSATVRCENAPTDSGDRIGYPENWKVRTHSAQDEFGWIWGFNCSKNAFLKAEIVQNRFCGALAQETHPQLLGRHPDVPLKCFRLCEWHPCKTLQKTLSLKTLQVLSPSLLRSSNKQSCGTCFGATCQIWLPLKESSKLKGWTAASSACSLHHFDLSRIDDSLLVLFTTHLHTESKSSGSVQVVDPKMGLKAAHVSQKLILSLWCFWLWYFWWKDMESIQLLQTVRGKDAPLHNKYHINVCCKSVRQSNCAQWYEPRSPLWLPVLPWMWRAGPSAPCRKGICDTEKNSFDLQGDRQVPSVVDTFPSCNWTLQGFVWKRHPLLFPASVWAARGLSKLLAANGDMSSKQPTANDLLGSKKIWYDLNM